jgi:hypothetical protein
VAYATACLVAVAVFHALVDADGVYDAVSLDALEPYRNRDDRTGKAEMLSAGDCETLLLGTSRVDSGIDPDGPALRSKNAYNVGMAALTAGELNHVLDFACRYNDLRHVILFLDLLQFNASRAPQVQFFDSRFNPDCNLLRFHFDHLVGGAGRPWSVLRRARLSEPGSHTLRGQYRRRPPKIGYREAFARRATCVIENRDLLGGFVYSVEEVELLRPFIAKCRAKQINLTVVINPVHALCLEMLYEIGLWEQYERWKRDLVALLADEHSRHPAAPPIQLWDFSGSAAYAHESVPEVGDLLSRMCWHWDIDHYTPALGELMLKRITGVSSLESEDVEVFGVLLTPANIDSHLADIRASRAGYARQYGHEIAWIAGICRREVTPILARAP